MRTSLPGAVAVHALIATFTAYTAAYPTTQSSQIYFIHNKAGHHQTFTVKIHGYLVQRVVVNAFSTLAFPVYQDQHGTVIASYGLPPTEAEQAEFCNGCFMGMDYLDISNNLGAGGDLTIQHLGNSRTRKGDPNFMEQFNEAWKTASQSTRDSIAEFLDFDADGTVVKVGHIKHNPVLEHFVRGFANCETYIGVGSTPGRVGNSCDDSQSSGGGNRDVIVTYGHGNALPDEVEGNTLLGNTVNYLVAMEKETASTIAPRFGLSEAQLKSANPGQDWDDLRQGQIVQLMHNEAKVALTAWGAHGLKLAPQRHYSSDSGSA